MKVLLLLAKPLLLVLLLLAGCARLNLAALRKDQDVLATFAAVHGQNAAAVQEREQHLRRQISSCNAVLVATLVALAGLAVYDTQRSAKPSL